MANKIYVLTHPGRIAHRGTPKDWSAKNSLDFLPGDERPRHRTGVFDIGRRIELNVLVDIDPNGVCDSHASFFATDDRAVIEVDSAAAEELTPVPIGIVRMPDFAVLDASPSGLTAE